MLTRDLFENKQHDAYSVFQQLAAAVNQSKDIDLQIGHEMMPIAYWQARHLLGKYKSIAKAQGPDAGMAFLSDYNAVNDTLDAMDAKLAAMKNVGSLPGQRGVEEAHNHDHDNEPDECWRCRGTGEGQWDGASCDSCGGTGIVKPKRDDDDFDIPDDDDMYEGELNTSWMNKQSQDFYNKNPNFKRSDRETKSLGNNRLATRVGPAGGLPKVAKKAMTPFKSMAKEDARPGPLERTAPHIQKKTSDQIAHLNALNGLEETVSLLKAANRRVTENLLLMSEAGSPAQQAAIAIAMKKAGKKPKGVREDYKPSMKMADYMAQADRLHDEMMRCQHAGDEAGYERAKQKYVELEKQARQGMVPEGSLEEVFEPTLNYYKLSNGKIVQASYRPNVNQSPVPFTDVSVSYVNPALKPQGPSFDSTGVAKPWTSAPDGVKQAIQKFATQPQQGVAEGGRHQRDMYRPETDRRPDTSNSLATRSIQQAEKPNVTKSADGHPTVKHSHFYKTANTRVEPTITPTTVKRKDSDRPIPSFLQKGVAEEVDTGQYDAIKSTKGQSTDDWDKNYREKIKQYAKELDQRQKEKEQTVKEGQEDLDAILRIIRK